MNISAILHTRELTPRLFSRPAKQSWTYNPSDALSATPVLYLFFAEIKVFGRDNWGGKYVALRGFKPLDSARR
jgi:hypothetical protein